MIGRLRETLARLTAVMRRRSLDAEFDEEVAAHIDLIADTFEQRGLPRSEARRRAILQMGGLNPTRDVHRDARGLPAFERAL